MSATLGQRESVVRPQIRFPKHSKHRMQQRVSQAATRHLERLLLPAPLRWSLTHHMELYRTAHLLAEGRVTMDIASRRAIQLGLDGTSGCDAGQVEVHAGLLLAAAHMKGV